MNRLRLAVALAGVLATTGVARGQNIKQQYVGKSSCAPDIKSDYADFGLTLDESQRLSLIHRWWDTLKVVLIIQHKDDNDSCGVIRDAIKLPNIGEEFEFRCVDPQSPTDVILGTSTRKGSTKPIIAIKAWRIDLKGQKFIETAHKVTCSAKGWADEDNFTDLVSEAKKHAAQHKAAQSKPQSNH